jgi:hypothetical protein
MCLPGVPSLPVSLCPAASVGPSVFASGSDASSAELELELELLLELLASGFPLAAPFPSSPGKGNSAAVLAAEAVPGVAPGASGACRTPFGFAGAPYGVSDAPLPPPLPSSGNGNCSAALCFPEAAGVVPHGTGCGVTEHGAGPPDVFGNGLAAGVLCATHATAHAIHTTAAGTTPGCLRIVIPFPFSLDDSPRAFGIVSPV